VRLQDDEPGEIRMHGVPSQRLLSAPDTRTRKVRMAEKFESSTDPARMAPRARMGDWLPEF
jgi:hypothetical protein